MTPSAPETEKAIEQWDERNRLITDNEKYVRHGQILIVRDDSDRRAKVYHRKQFREQPPDLTQS